MSIRPRRSRRKTREFNGWSRQPARRHRPIISDHLGNSRMVTVGKRVTLLPPRRSRRALLTHRAPPSGRALSGMDPLFARRTVANQIDAATPALCPDRGCPTAVSLRPGPFRHRRQKRGKGAARRVGLKDLNTLRSYSARALRVRLWPCVDGSLLARVFVTLMQCGRVLPCVRPVDAAHGRWP